jgi:hypothetical protein
VEARQWGVGRQGQGQGGRREWKGRGKGDGGEWKGRPYSYDSDSYSHGRVLGQSRGCAVLRLCAVGSLLVLTSVCVCLCVLRAQAQEAWRRPLLPRRLMEG